MSRLHVADQEICSDYNYKTLITEGEDQDSDTCKVKCLRARSLFRSRNATSYIILSIAIGRTT